MAPLLHSSANGVHPVLVDANTALFFFFNTFSAHHLSDLQLFFSSSKIAFSALRGNRYTKRRSIAASLDRNLIQRFQEGGGGAGVEGR